MTTRTQDKAYNYFTLDRYYFLFVRTTKTISTTHTSEFNCIIIHSGRLFLFFFSSLELSVIIEKPSKKCRFCRPEYISYSRNTSSREWNNISKTSGLGEYLLCECISKFELYSNYDGKRFRANVLIAECENVRGHCGGPLEMWTDSWAGYYFKW